MSKFTNPKYREFLDKGSIRTIGEEDIKTALNKIKNKHAKEGRALLITLYYTGARPNEILRLKSKDITRQNNYIIIQTPGSKGGLPRPIHLQYKQPLVKELYNYASTTMPEAHLFYHYQSHYTRTIKTPKGDIKTYHEISAKLRHYFNQWFNGDIPPYFLRHNRFSKLMEEGADAEDIRILKGARSHQSVTPYLHLSKKKAQQIGRKIK